MLNFEKFVLEAEEAKNTDAKDEAKVNPETEEEMEEAYTDFMVESIQLQIALVKADAYCMEQYMEATTESAKADIVATYEGAVSEFFDRWKDKLGKASETVANWFEKRAKFFDGEIKMNSKKFMEKYADVLNSKDCDQVMVPWYEVPVAKAKAFSGREQVFINAAKEIAKADSAEKLEALTKKYEGKADDAGFKALDKELGDYIEELNKGKSTEVKFGSIKRKAIANANEASCSNVVKAYVEGGKEMKAIKAEVLNLPVEERNPFSKTALSTATKYANRAVRAAKLVARTNALAYKFQFTVAKRACVKAVQGKGAAQKAATESYSLLDDMLASVF